MKTKLTKEESAHLINLGVPKEKASDKEAIIDRKGDGFPTITGYASIFRLTDLLEILPKEIELERKPKHFAQLSILYRLERWWVEYQDITLSVRIKEELIDALYELTIWCIENKHLKL